MKESFVSGVTEMVVFNILLLQKLDLVKDLVWAIDSTVWRKSLMCAEHKQD